jgi:hypothetical protein
MKKFVCVYKTGGDYRKEHVMVLHAQVKRMVPVVDQFICYTDVPEQFTGTEVIAKPLISTYTGRFCMHEAFRETGHVMVTGLDTVFLKDVSWLFDIEIAKDELYGMKPWAVKWGNNPMLWNGDFNVLFDPNEVQGWYRLEQVWAYDKMLRNGITPKRLNVDHNLRLASYKHDCKNGEPDADMVIFHGKPRPHEVNKDWVKKYYRL